MQEEDRLTLRNRNWGGDAFNWRVEPDRTVQDGDKIPTGCGDIEVIWTPGHSLEHICLYDRGRKILFSGDHILPITTPHVGSDPFSPADPLGNYFNSLEKVSQLDVDLVMPGHQHILRNLRKRVRQILEHHKKRLEDLLNILDSEEKTAYQLASKMSWVGIWGFVIFPRIITKT